MEVPLKEIIKRIVEEVDPDRIILFGSRVKGESTKWNDYDICVLKGSINDRSRLEKKIYRKLFGAGVSVDIIVETPEKFNELKDKWFLIYNEIANSGRVVYEK